MEAVVAPYSAERHRQSLSISPHNNKQMHSRFPGNRARRSGNLAAVQMPPEASPQKSFYGGGLIGSSCNNHNFLLHPPIHSSTVQKQPPLLPLPAMPKANASSYPPPNSARPKPQRLARHHSLNSPDKALLRRQGSAAATARGSATGGRVHGPGPLGPDPNVLPRYISGSRVPNPPAAVVPLETGSFSGSIFELAPPPSCLPLPKFSLRPKLGCNAEAGGDEGATDGLRRILRLP